MENLGERHVLMKTAEGTDAPSMDMKFQVVDVSKPLLSVHRECEKGHEVRFTNKGEGSAILMGGDPSNRIPLCGSGGNYEVGVWVRPSQDFIRPR